MDLDAFASSFPCFSKMQAFSYIVQDCGGRALKTFSACQYGECKVLDNGKYSEKRITLRKK